MKKSLLTFILICCASLINAQTIDSQLLDEINRRADDDEIEVVVVMKARYDRTLLNQKADAFTTRAERMDFVAKELKTFAEKSQKNLVNYLENTVKINNISSLHFANALYFSATKAVIMEIANRDDVEIIGLNKKQNLIPECRNARPCVSTDASREITPNVLQVNAEQVWAQGYTGAGVIVAVVDSGVNYEHADVADHLWDGGDEFPHHGYDIVNGDNDPMDDIGHGTHVAGIVCGDGTSGSQTGVAPDATLMCVKSIAVDGFGGAVNIAGGMEWAVEHDCDMISMSLGMAGASVTDKIVLRRTCVAVNDAGIVAAVCAGNEGLDILLMAYPIPDNVRVPASCPPPYLDPDQLVNPGELSCVIAVGAVDGNDAAASFTSRGPVTWQDTEFGDYAYEPGIGLIRPDVCAPGVAVKSLDYQNINGYTNMDGTSQATPCVSGIVALMLQKNPNLMPADICRILEETSLKLTPNKSNITGVGRVDALAAINAVEPYDAIEENEIEEVKIYPNPAYDVLFVLSENINSEYRIINILGETVIFGKIASENHQIDVSSLPEGMYFITVDGSTIKFLKE
jgi:serine protease AprX